MLGDLVLARLGLTLAIAARRVVTEVGQRRLHRAVRRPHPHRPRASGAPTGPELRSPTGCTGWPGPGPAGSPTEPTCSSAGTARWAGGSAPLFYAEPLEIVRGEGPWLIAADGTRYLDAYNNVAVVGHAHPAVTQAVSRQLADAEHPQPLPAPADRGAGRAAARHHARRARHLPVHHLRHRGQRARLADGDRPHRRQRRAVDRRARLPRLLEVDGRPELQRMARRPPAGPRRHLRRTAASDGRHRPRNGGRPDRRPPPTTWPARATVRRSSSPTSASPARASSTLRRSSCAGLVDGAHAPAPCSSPTRSSPASAAAARSCGGSQRPGSRRTSSRSASRWVPATRSGQ